MNRVPTKAADPVQSYDVRYLTGYARDIFCTLIRREENNFPYLVVIQFDGGLPILERAFTYRMVFRLEQQYLEQAGHQHQGLHMRALELCKGEPRQFFQADFEKEGVWRRLGWS